MTKLGRQRQAFPFMIYCIYSIHLPSVVSGPTLLVLCKKWPYYFRFSIIAVLAKIPAVLCVARGLVKRRRPAGLGLHVPLRGSSWTGVDRLLGLRQRNIASRSRVLACRLPP
jgi:hypothetical protein